MKWLINYADNRFRKQQRFAEIMANQFGSFDKVICYGPDDIDNDFKATNHSTLSESRGGGYWLWKPYFIVETLKLLKPGEILFYADSGAFFVKPVDSILGCWPIGQDVIGFQLPLIEVQWTKTELLDSMGCNREEFTQTNQMSASFIVFKKSEESVKFAEEYLKLCSKKSHIDDSISCEQAADFIEHRHDQSVFSLLYKKYGFIPMRDPTQLGVYPRGYSASNSCPSISKKLLKLDNGRLFLDNDINASYRSVIYHNRVENPFLALIKYNIKRVLFHLGLYKGMVR